MPWNPCDAMELKRDFVELAGRDGANIRDICRRFGISAPTGYKWLKRYEEQGLEGLEEHSRAPLKSPSRISAGMEKRIVGVREAHPAWGGRKIKGWLENRGLVAVPSASTVTAVLRRHQLLEQPAGPSGSGWQRFERNAPNELWQMDFKGWIRTRHGSECHPLTALDDHSRYNLILEACRRETLGEVQPILQKAFAMYGLPAAILCDNGSPWGCSTGLFTKLEMWLLKLGVTVYHGRPHHPQTQGKEERFHRTLKAEVLSRTTEWRDLAHCQSSFQAWREVYNHERPHEALGGAVPSSRYQASSRTMPRSLPEAGQWYGEGDLVKKINSKGSFSFKNHLWAIGEALNHEKIALRESADGRFDVYFCWKKIGVIDLKALTTKSGKYQQLTH